MHSPNSLYRERHELRNRFPPHPHLDSDRRRFPAAALGRHAMAADAVSRVPDPRGRIRGGSAGARQRLPDRHRAHGYRPARHERARGRRSDEGAVARDGGRDAHHARHAGPSSRGRRRRCRRVRPEARNGRAPRGNHRAPAREPAREDLVMTLSSGTDAPKSDRPAFSRQLFLDGVHEARRANRSLAILVVDLDRFRRINDAFGRDAGNRVLREAAERIGRCVRGADLVSRLGGDEFAVLLESVESPGLADTIADGIRSEINRPFLIEDREVYLSASVGIALAPRDGGSAEELLQRADIAMSHAKKLRGDNRQAYSSGSETRISAKLDMEARLRRALELGGLEVHYQPQTSLADDAIHSVEALLRWNDPELGWVSPAEFIPLAEETGLIHRIGAWVLETATAQAKAWQDAGLRPIRMCINVSARQLNDRLVEIASRALARTGLSPSSVELEITESVKVTKDAGTETALEALRVLGVGIALDDFGTGYATFDYLRRLPVRTLKLEGSFVRGVCENTDDAAIIAASVSLARNLGLRTVAEGGETAEQCERVRKLGCDDGQGYHLCRPLPAAALKNLLGSKPRAQAG